MSSQGNKQTNKNPWVNVVCHSVRHEETSAQADQAEDNIQKLFFSTVLFQFLMKKKYLMHCFHYIIPNKFPVICKITMKHMIETIFSVFFHSFFFFFLSLIFIVFSENNGINRFSPQICKHKGQWLGECVSQAIQNLLPRLKQFEVLFRTYRNGMD